ncbi:MAG: glutathione-dependent formaldehyde dehydrogenase [Chloroflexi bacterium]|nr:glutathione-dependent formaldehyde dehydrogenase [Chloroflexota bacterium]
MNAVRYHKPKDMRVDNVDDPRVEEPRDAIVRVTSTAICGSDLHLYNGLIPQLHPMTMGHEFMGIVEDVGKEVTNLKKGDRVVVPFPIACGRCYFCTHALPTACENSNPNYGPQGGLLKEKGGALFGYTDLYGGYAGGQAEAVRVPYADYGPRKVPEGLTDEQVLFLTDILSTGWTGVDKAQLKGGETVAVFGCGPVGLMAQKLAWIAGAERVIGFDRQQYRVDMAKKVANSEAFDVDEIDPVDKVRELTDGRGADVCIDAVGMEAEADAGVLERVVDIAIKHQGGSLVAFKRAVDAVRRGGVVTVLGVYTTDYEFPWGQMFDKGVQVWGGQAPVHNYIDYLLQLIQDGKVRADDIITHTLPLDEAPHGYDIFNKKEDNCVKVVLKP